MKDKKKIKKRGRILYLISTIVLILIALMIVYFAFYYRADVFTSIDFSKCTKGTCTYKVKLDNKVYELKYVNIIEDNNYDVGTILSKVYLNDKLIIKNSVYNRVLDMNQLNDLLVFGKKAGDSPSGQYIEVFNKNSELVSKINVLDEELEMYPSPVKEIYLGEDGYSDLRIDTYFYEIKDNILLIYGSRFDNSWQMKVKNTYSMVEDLPELIIEGKISASEEFSGIYEINYDELINGKNPKLKEITQTVGEVAEVFDNYEK